MNIRRSVTPPYIDQNRADSETLKLDKEILLSRKIEIVYGYLPSGLLASTFVSTIIVLFLARGSNTPLTTIYWGVAMALVIILRLADSLTYRKRSNNQQIPSQWNKRFLAGVTVQGIIWGIGGYCLFPDSPLDQMFFISAFGGMSGGALIFLSPIWPAFIIYSSALIVPVCLRLLLAGQPAYWMTGLMLLVYLFSLMVISIKTGRWINNYLVTSLENEVLAENLQTACLALEGYQEDLERLIDERTTELSVSNLQLQKEMHEKDAEKLKAELSEARFRELAELLPEMIFETDRKGALCFLNRKGGELTGLSSDPPPTGVMLSDIFLPEDRKQVEENLQRLMEGEVIGSSEFTALRTDGSVFPVLTVSSPIVRHGVVCGLRGIMMDTTRIKELELSLRHAQKMEAVGQLAGGIAHDFNNILTAIYGYCAILQMKIGEDSPFISDINHIYSAAERAANLTRSLLAFSRKQVMRTKMVNLNDIVINVGQLLSRIIGEDIHMKIMSAVEPLNIIADSGQIEQVLMNLAANARDAMPKGGLLTIGTEIREIDQNFIHTQGFGISGKYAVISVSDTGTGMDAETSKRIFEPFFTTKEVGKGTGLGLSIIDGIINQHNGFISVYSEPDSGTTFNIYIPQACEENSDHIEKEHSEYPLMGSETILLAEDDPSIRKLADLILRQFGYNVILAEDGTDAIEKFNDNKEKIAIIVMDMIMPRKSGKEAYDEIRKIRPEVKILFMSGYSPDLLQDKGILVTGEEVLIKPIHPLDLVRKVRAVLDHFESR